MVCIFAYLLIKIFTKSSIFKKTEYYANIATGDL